MDINCKASFEAAFRNLDAHQAPRTVDDPRLIREAFEQDQQQLDNAELYQDASGRFFEIARTLPCGTVVTEDGNWLSPEEFAAARRVV